MIFCIPITFTNFIKVYLSNKAVKIVSCPGGEMMIKRNEGKNIFNKTAQSILSNKAIPLKIVSYPRGERREAG